MPAIRAANDSRLPGLARAFADLSSRDEVVSSAAAGRLEELAPTADETAVLLGERSPFVRSGAARWLRHLGPLPASVADALRAAIYDQNPFVIQAALGTAGILKLQAARADARACLEDDNPCVIHAAIFALGRLGPAEEGIHLTRFLAHPEQHLQVAAVTALSSLEYRPATPALIARLESARSEARTSLAGKLVSALASLGATEALPVLVRIAREDEALRGLAVQALIDLKAPEAAPALVPLLEQALDGSQDERLSCRLLFLMTSSDHRFAMPVVRAYLAHRQPGVRCAALKAVTAWKDADAVSEVRRMAREDASAFVRPVAVTALADLAGRDAVPDLERLASDSNALVRSAATASLVRLGEVGVRPIVQPLKVSEGPALVPGALRGQAAAARAFLKSWLAEGATGEIAEALVVLVRALEHSVAA